MSINPAVFSSPPGPTVSDSDTGAGSAHTAAPLSALERRLLDEFQHGFPLRPAPYAEIGSRLGVSEATVIDTLRDLRARGYVSRVGPVFAAGRAGCSVLAALAVPAARVDEVSALVSGFPEVNHNYEREHVYNLWFVVTGGDEDRVSRAIDEIELRTGLEALRLPLECAYHIDLGFPLWP